MPSVQKTEGIFFVFSSGFAEGARVVRNLAFVDHRFVKPPASGQTRALQSGTDENALGKVAAEAAVAVVLCILIVRPLMNALKRRSSAKAEKAEAAASPVEVQPTEEAEAQDPAILD